MNLSPAVILYNADGTAAVTVSDGTAYPVGAQAIPVAGRDDAGNAQFVRTEADGTVRTDPTGTTSQPVTGPLTDAQLRAFPVTVDTAQLPAALVGGRVDENVGAWLGSTAPTVGRKAMGASLPVTFSSDQPPLPVTFTAVNAVTGVSFANLVLGGGTAGTLQVLRTTTYVEPATAAQRSFVSSSVNDSAAGTGARTIKITYFDNAGTGPFNETVTLNGTTAVNTAATDIRFIEKMEVMTAGSLGANSGTLSLYSATGGGGTVIGSVGVANLIPGRGDNRTAWAHHYTAVGWIVETAALYAGIQSGGSGTSGQFFLLFNQPLVANSADLLREGILLLHGTFTREYAYHTIQSGFSRITAYCIPSVNNAVISAAFDWSEVPV